MDDLDDFEDIRPPKDRKRRRRVGNDPTPTPADVEATSSTAAAASDGDDDVLVLPPPRGRSPWRRILAGGLAVAMFAGLVGGVALALSQPAPSAPPTAAAAKKADANADVSAPDAPPAADTEPDPAAATASMDPNSEHWPVPRDPKAGPKQWKPTQASGFSRDARGAAWAAATITARLDPFMGPPIFTPALRQTTGHTKDLAPLLSASYVAAGVQAGQDTSSGAPITADGIKSLPLAGWATKGPCRDQCTVLLAVDDAGARWVQTAAMVWTAGDWRLHLTDPDRILDPRQPADPKQTFHPYTVKENA